MSIFIFDIVALIACHSLRNFPSQKILLALRDAINNPLSLSFIFSFFLFGKILLIRERKPNFGLEKSKNSIQIIIDNEKTSRLYM